MNIYWLLDKKGNSIKTEEDKSLLFKVVKEDEKGFHLTEAGRNTKELVKDKEYTLVIDPPIGDGYGVGLLEYHVVFNGEYFKLDDNYDNSNVIDIEWN